MRFSPQKPVKRAVQRDEDPISKWCREEWPGYRGLITCGHCGCAITAQKKKGRYIYYHCSEKRGPCKENGYIKEEELTEQYSEYLDTFKLPEELYGELVKVIRELHDLKSRDVEQRITILNAEASRIRRKRNSIYQDKLNGSIKNGFWKEHHDELSKELEGVSGKLQRIDKADLEFFALAERILAFLKDVSGMFKGGNMRVKREILKLMVRTSRLSSGRLINSGTEPFSTLKNRTLPPLVGEERFELSTSCSQSRRA
ncbi:MAG TPA: hypothetical protein ENN67_02300, partial [Firmicutes bacterium]|nr:hypothetical protein [Bacillota bacterium]